MGSTMFPQHLTGVPVRTVQYWLMPHQSSSPFPLWSSVPGSGCPPRSSCSAGSTVAVACSWHNRKALVAEVSQWVQLWRVSLDAI